MQRITIHIVLPMLMILAGCTGNIDRSGISGSCHQGSIAKTYVYQCEDGYSFTVRVEGKTAWLFLPERTIHLPQVPAVSGAKYGRDAILFWNKGNRAGLKTDRRMHGNCKNNRVRAIWEHAKLSGVDFRAAGHEPGWYLEIKNIAAVAGRFISPKMSATGLETFAKQRFSSNFGVRLKF